MLSKKQMEKLAINFPVGSQWKLGGGWMPGGNPVTVEGIDWDGMVCVRRDDTCYQPWADGKLRMRVKPSELV